MRDTITDPSDNRTPSERGIPAVPRTIDVAIVVTFDAGDETQVRVVLDVDDLDLVDRLRADGLTWEQAIAAAARVRSEP